MSPADPDLATDVLGAPYVVETLVLEPDDEGAVEANLVRRPADEPTGRAVLYVHGFADYFFQTEFAEWWTSRGYDFYALDLRKYGRSLREHQTPNYVDDVHTYFEDIDAAWSRVVERDGHDHVVLAAHSTGGLVASLWAHHRRPDLAALVLNSPWLDMQGPFLLRTVGTVAVRGVALRRPMRPIGRNLNTFYGQSLHRDHGGEWDYDLTWKPLDSWPIYFGWLAAIRRGARRAAPRARGVLPGPGAVLGREPVAQADVRARARSRHRARRRTDPALGAGHRAARHRRVDPRGPARRGALPPRGAQPRLRRARPMGHGVRRVRRLPRESDPAPSRPRVDCLAMRPPIPPEETR